MKNFIFKYSNYEKDIFKGETIVIKYIYFSGIEIAELEAFICYNAITEDDRVINIKFRLMLESVFEKEELKQKYSHLFLSGISLSHTTPELLVLSCFYKQKVMNQDTFIFYGQQTNADNNMIYRLSMYTYAFLEVMYVFEAVREYKPLNQQNIIDIDKFNTLGNLTLEKVSNKYKMTYEDKVKIAHTKPKLFSSNIDGIAVITFDNGENKFSITANLIFDKSLAKDKRFTTSAKLFKKQCSELEHPLYYTVLSFPIEYSITADTPMCKLAAMSVNECNSSGKCFVLPFNSKHTFCKALGDLL